MHSLKLVTDFIALLSSRLMERCVLVALLSFLAHEIKNNM